MSNAFKRARAATAQIARNVVEGNDVSARITDDSRGTQLDPVARGLDDPGPAVRTDPLDVAPCDADIVGATSQEALYDEENPCYESDCCDQDRDLDRNLPLV